MEELNNQITEQTKDKNLLNIAILDLLSNTQKQCQVELDKVVIKQASNIFVKDLLEYAKAGGNLKDIRVEDVYKNILSSSK